MITTNFQHSTFGIAILWAKIWLSNASYHTIYSGAYGKPESGIRNPEPEPETEMEPEPELEPELKLRPG